MQGTRQRRTDPRDFEARQGRVFDDRFAPSVWDQRADLLLLEGEVRQDGDRRREKLKHVAAELALDTRGFEGLALKTSACETSAAALYVVGGARRASGHACRLMELA
jgi:hypothetical protein